MKKFTGMIAVVLTMCIVLSVCAEAAYKNPQKYSTDGYQTDDEFWAEVNAIEIPEEKKQKGIAVWLNVSEISLKEEAVFKDGTVYVPFEEFFTQAGFTAEISGKNAKISGNGTEVSFKRGSETVTINGENISLSHPQKKIGGCQMVSADLIEKVLDAKVWYDVDGNTLAVSTEKYKDDEIMRIVNGKLYMNGQPYYEISFNKWDLSMQIAGGGEWSKKELQYSAAEEALSLLHENGFKSIRVFLTNGVRGAYFRSDKQKETFYELMDSTFDLCDKYDIKVNCCLSLISSEFVAKGESMSDLYCVPESESRKLLNQFIDEFVTKYKDRKTVLMWEIVNEGNLQADIGWSAKNVCPSAKTLGNLYADIAARIKMNDPDRLVTGGDGDMRSAQFNLYMGTRLGMVGSNWTQDTLEERLIALQLLYHGVDVISVHSYDAGLNEIYYPESRDNMDSTKHQDLNLYMSEAKRLGKVLYDGETSYGKTSIGYDDSAFTKEELDEYLQGTIDAGVQLTHWWCFHCDREGHEAEDTYTWDMTFGNGLASVKEANEKLQARYVVNGLEPGNAPETGCGSSFGGITVMTVILAAAFVLGKKKVHSK